MPSGGHNKGQIGVKLRAGLRYLLEEDDDLYKAAKHCGMTTKRIREALKRPHVRSWFQAEKKALLDIYCAGNPAALKDIRDNSENQMSRVQAVRTMEQLVDDQPGGRPNTLLPLPGLVIQINTGRVEPRTIDHEPGIIDHQPADPVLVDRTEQRGPSHG